MLQIISEVCIDYFCVGFFMLFISVYILPVFE